MLVLSRKIGERLWIGDEIAITVVKVAGGGVRLGIEAPPNLLVIRDELKNRGPLPPSAAAASGTGRSQSA